MSTEAAVAVSTPAPSAPVTGGDDFTPEERAYFDSRGEKTDGLVSEPAPVSKSAPVTKTDTAPVGTDANDEAVDGEVALDVNGNVRDLKSGKFVPKSAFLRVKEESKQTKAENQALRDAVVANRERLAILTEANAPAQQQAPVDDTPPDPETDIFGYVKWQAKQIAKLNEQLTRTTTETREQFEGRAMQEGFKADVARFEQQKPEFREAYSYLVAQRHAELEAMGVVDPRQRDAHIQDEATTLVKDALKGKRSAAEQIYKLATARGFAPKAANDTAAQNAAAEIERIKNGQQAAASLRSAGSGSGVGEQLTVQKLANMSDNEYTSTRSAYIAKHGKSAWTQLTGMG